MLGILRIETRLFRLRLRPLMVTKLVSSLAALVAGGVFCIEPAAAGSVNDEFAPEDRAHWAFQRVIRPECSVVTHGLWVRNPIDAFVASRLEANQIEPGPAADKITLIRRAYLDLIGLPPRPDEVDVFLADHSSQAFAQVVDRLLASPHYGE